MEKLPWIQTIDQWTQGFLVGLAFVPLILILIARFIGNYNELDDRKVAKMREYIPRAEKYYLQSYRYLELKAFCRQYQSWQVGLRSCYGFKANNFDSSPIKGSEHSDPTERAVEMAEKYRLKIDMVELAARQADESLASYILLNVTQGLGFDSLERMGKRPPCGVNQFYEARQKFFWILDQLKE